MMKHERGNILFLILLAVFLFAALSYAVTQSTRGGGNSASKESTDVMASELINNGALMKAATDRLRLVNGCNETDISLCIPGGLPYPGWCGPKTQCQLFNTNTGSNLNIRLPNTNFAARNPAHNGDGLAQPPNTLTYWTADGWHVVPDINTSKPELIVMAPDIKKDICDAINRAANIPTLGTFISAATPWWNQWDPTTYLYTKSDGTTQPLPSQYTGKEFGCFHTSNDGWYNFYQVLIPR